LDELKSSQALVASKINERTPKDEQRTEQTPKEALKSDPKPTPYQLMFDVLMDDGK
jgi:hypothetical protein